MLVEALALQGFTEDCGVNSAMSRSTRPVILSEVAASRTRSSYAVERPPWTFTHRAINRRSHDAEKGPLRVIVNEAARGPSTPLQDDIFDVGTKKSPASRQGFGLVAITA